MYKKLEADQESRTAAEKAPEGDCVCSCKQEEESAEKEAPSTNYTTVSLGVYFDVNG